MKEVSGTFPPPQQVAREVNGTYLYYGVLFQRSKCDFSRPADAFCGVNKLSLALACKKDWILRVI